MDRMREGMRERERERERERCNNIGRGGWEGEVEGLRDW